MAKAIIEEVAPQYRALGRWEIRGGPHMMDSAYARTLKGARRKARRMSSAPRRVYRVSDDPTADRIPLRDLRAAGLE